MDCYGCAGFQLKRFVNMVRCGHGDKEPNRKTNKLQNTRVGGRTMIIQPFHVCFFLEGRERSLWRKKPVKVN